MTLIDGILNLLLSVGCCAYLGLIGLASMGLGLICVPLAIYPLVLGILELVQYGPINSEPPRRRDVPIWLAIMQLIATIFFNPLALATGIVGLIASNDANVRAYLGGGGGRMYLGIECKQCGFDLRGSVAAGRNTCPECGADAPHVTAARDSMRA